MKDIIRGFRDGIHSNIPLCCVIQWVIEDWVIRVLLGGRGSISVADLPWREPHFDESSDSVDHAMYWPCSIHQWLIDRKFVKPRVLNICDPGEAIQMQDMATCRPCPHCSKRSKFRPGDRVKITRCGMDIPASFVGLVGVIDHDVGLMMLGVASGEYRVNLVNGGWCYAMGWKLEKV